MTVLILGSEGFIGSHCVRYLLQCEHEVWGVDLYEQATMPYRYSKVSRLSPELEELFATTNFDAVINAAGSGSVAYSMAHPLLDFEANSLDTIRVLDAIRKHQPSCRYLHLSSAAVYGNPVRLPVQESDRLQPLSPYGWHKQIAETICSEYAAVYGLSSAIVRSFSAYGPGLKKQFFWELYRKIRSADGPVELFGTGQESRDYIYIEDLVKALALVLEKGKMQGEVYNLASGIETTIAAAAQCYFEALGTAVPYRFNGVVRKGDPLNWRADISKIQALGFRTDTTLQEGLKTTAAWIKQAT